MGSPPPRRRGSTDEAAGLPGLLSSNGSSRAVSTALDYTMTLAVATLVVTALFIAAGDFVTERREDVVRTELEVVGQRLANDVATADRLAQAGSGANAVAINASLPATVTGSTYSVAVESAGSTSWINLTTARPSVSVSVRLETQTDLASSSVHGSSVSVVYDPATDELEVRS